MALPRVPTVFARRLVGFRPAHPRSLGRVQARYASQQATEVTEDDVAAFHAFLESSPSEAQLETFRTTRKFKDIVRHLKNEGATEDEIDQMTQPVIDDPGMNGGYVNPARQKRSLRDPYEDWWDKQERRNYGEPVHEDNDMLGVFSLEEYNQWSAGRAFRYFVGYFAAIGAFSAGIYHFAYPQKPGVKREFPQGLEKELGGPGTMSAPSSA